MLNIHLEHPYLSCIFRGVLLHIWHCPSDSSRKRARECALCDTCCNVVGKFLHNL
ncbi:hypothetical protein HanXRQr2_Chr12g0526391 [Helianthus annuus]|uniref:Uncharacterized protein n=1 Tax=Helianthus annuus TaxID=4232 RepID=A0A9K3EPT8_HELAN|nr:hypothetical protein HanXRQr2_Chr12g0526391 [Helianthus annuus]KAJ0861482.1 hypothetical protein HanPSC8_Chr12g0507161 [Helianthus annuus]